MMIMEYIILCVSALVFPPELPRLKNGVLNPNLDYARLQSSYVDNYPELLFYDDFLTQEALTALINYCLG